MFKRSKTPAVLQNSALAELPRWEQNRLDQLGTAVEVKSGRQIIAKETHGREVFVIINGDFEVEADGVKASLSEGDVAGELAMLTGRPRSASVAASSDGLVYAMNSQEFATLLHEAPQFRERVVNSASARLSNAGEPAREFATYFR